MHIDILFIFVFLIFPVIWNLILKSFKINIFQVSIISILFASIVVFQYIGIPILYFKFDYYRAIDVNDSLLVFKVFLFTSITVTLLLFGYGFFKKTNKLNKHKNFSVTLSNNFIYKYFVILFSICIYFLINYINVVGFQNLAISSVLGYVSDNNLTLLRSNMTNAFTGYHWYYLFTNKILLFCTYFFYSQFLIKKTFKHKLTFYLAFFTCLVSLVLSTEKGPIIFFFISMLLVYLIVNKKSIIPIKLILKFVPIFIVILVVFYIFFTNIKSFDQALISVFSRTFTGQIQPAYHYLEFFPEIEPFLMGRSMTNPAGIFPWVPYNIPQEVMAWYNMNEFKSGVIGSMPTIFWGEVYANFGVLGVFSIPFLVGFILGFIDSLIKRFPRNTTFTAFYVTTIMHYVSLSTTSLSNFIFDIYIIIPFIIYLFIEFVSGKGKIIIRN